MRDFEQDRKIFEAATKGPVWQDRRRYTLDDAFNLIDALEENNYRKMADEIRILGLDYVSGNEVFAVLRVLGSIRTRISRCYDDNAQELVAKINKFIDWADHGFPSEVRS